MVGEAEGGKGVPPMRVDRAGSREAKGSSLKKSKKNPGAAFKVAQQGSVAQPR